MDVPFPGCGLFSVLRRALVPLLLAGDLLSLRAENWKKIATPHFQVISNASEDRTRAWATEFELFRRGIETLLPLPPGRLEPVHVVLFADDTAFKAFRPMEDGKPAAVAGIFRAMPSRPVMALSIAGARDDTREKVYTGAALWYLSGLDRPLPPWLKQGIAELFGSFNLRGASFEIGYTQTPYLKRVRSSLPLPFTQLAAMRTENLKFRGPGQELTERFFAQSWLTVHELIFAPDAPGFPALRRYLADPGAGEPEAEFEAIVGRSAADMDARTQAHLYRRFPDPLRTPLDRAAVEAGFQLTPAAPTDVDLALGTLLVGADREGEAGVYLWRAAVALPGDPRPSEALGEMEFSAKHEAESVAHYQEAIKRGATSFFARYIVAAAKLREQLGGPQLSQPDESDVAEALDLLAQSLARNPRFTPAYEALASVIVLVDVQTRAAEMQALLREGVRRNPQHPDLLLALGFSTARSGQLEEAKALLQQARQLAGTEDRRRNRFADNLAATIAARTARN